jgi:beta-glucanase (GH16 family)
MRTRSAVPVHCNPPDQEPAMRTFDVRPWCPAVLLLAMLCPSWSAETASKPLLDLAKDGIEKRFAPSSDQVGVARSADPAASGVVVTIKPGKDGYPGVDLKPEGGAWDLAAFGRIEARVANTGSKPLGLALRVDNAGDWRAAPWNTEQGTIKPGQAATIVVVFGHSNGLKRGFALDPAAVVNVKLFTLKADVETSFRLESLIATGHAGERPPLDPNAIRVRPVRGVILGADAASEVLVEEGRDTRPWAMACPGTPLPDVALRAEGVALRAEGADNAPVGQVARLPLPAGKGQQALVLKPGAGRWDLRAATQVRMRVKNDGATPVTPGLQVRSDGGQTDTVAAAAPLAPGAELELVAPFAASVPARAIASTRPGSFGCEKGTGTTFASDAASAIRITADHDGAGSLAVLALVAEAPAAALPEWLGKRPPVDGDWTQTLAEEFDGPAIDAAHWNIYGPNYWDRVSHWSKDNLILGGGVVKLRFERKTGFHNDDPNQKRPANLSGSNASDYACGYLDSLGKWVQRYGYFEARVKLPEAPGLWPTFWMMPDRGVGIPGRSGTGDGAMEMDIMEHLTRWGPHRYNIADHWDGYGKDHVSSGTTMNYVAADKDGFITCGLLWTPGVVAYYGNGKELVRMETPRISSVPSYFIFEVTTGGWDNDSVDDARLPVDYVIDYVRCWQRKDLASAPDAPKAPAGR